MSMNIRYCTLYMNKITESAHLLIIYLHLRINMKLGQKPNRESKTMN